MPGLSEARLGHAQDSREHLFHDICQVQVRTTTQSMTTGEQTDVFAEGASFDCSIKFTSAGGERHQSDLTQVEQDAVIRFPLGTVFTVKDKLKLTHRYGEALTVPILFEIKGEQALDVIAGRVAVKKVDH
jgi:hypothetical protein